MKITDIRVVRMGAPLNNWNWVFVIVETDAGIRGVGEGSLQYKDLALMADIKDLSRWLIGQDPFQIEHIWHVLYRQVTWTGGPVAMSAVSAIDLALHDIKGKALGVPVYELLGAGCGRRCPSMPMPGSMVPRGRKSTLNGPGGSCLKAIERSSSIPLAARSL